MSWSFGSPQGAYLAYIPRVLSNSQTECIQLAFIPTSKLLASLWCRASHSAESSRGSIFPVEGKAALNLDEATLRVQAQVPIW